MATSPFGSFFSPLGGLSSKTKASIGLAEDDPYQDYLSETARDYRDENASQGPETPETPKFDPGPYDDYIRPFESTVAPVEKNYYNLLPKPTPVRTPSHATTTSAPKKKESDDEELDKFLNTDAGRAVYDRVVGGAAPKTPAAKSDEDEELDKFLQTDAGRAAYEQVTGKTAAPQAPAPPAADKGWLARLGDATGLSGLAHPAATYTPPGAATAAGRYQPPVEDVGPQQPAPTAAPPAAAVPPTATAAALQTPEERRRLALAAQMAGTPDWAKVDRTGTPLVSASTSQPAVPTELGPASVPSATPTTNPMEWGTRADGSAKGMGFLGPIVRPDGRVSSELAIGVNIDGKNMDIPSMVPTLTKDEVQQLLTLPDKARTPKPIAEKAVAFARQRIAAGLSPFATTPEDVQSDLYPQFKRAAMDFSPPVSSFDALTATITAPPAAPPPAAPDLLTPEQQHRLAPYLKAAPPPAAAKTDASGKPITPETTPPPTAFGEGWKENTVDGPLVLPPKGTFKGKPQYALSDIFHGKEAALWAPGPNVALPLADAWDVLVASRHYKQDRLTADDKLTLERWGTEQQELAERGVSTGYQIGKIVQMLPEIAAEFMLSGGTFTAAREATTVAVREAIEAATRKALGETLTEAVARVGAESTIPRLTGETVAGTLTKNRAARWAAETAGVVAGTAARAVHPALMPRLALTIAEQQLPPSHPTLTKAEQQQVDAAQTALGPLVKEATPLRAQYEQAVTALTPALAALDKQGTELTAARAKVNPRDAASVDAYNAQLAAYTAKRQELEPQLKTLQGQQQRLADLDKQMTPHAAVMKKADLKSLDDTIKESDDSFLSAFARAYGQHFAFLLTGQAGEAFPAIGEALGDTRVGQVVSRSALAARIRTLKASALAQWFTLDSGNTMSKFAEQAGWHGVLGQIGEQWLYEGMSAPFAKPGTPPTPLIRLVTGARVPGAPTDESARMQALEDFAKQTAEQAVGFAVVPIAHKALSVAWNAATEAGVRERQLRDIFGSAQTNEPTTDEIIARRSELQRTRQSANTAKGVQNISRRIAALDAMIRERLIPPAPVGRAEGPAAVPATSDLRTEAGKPTGGTPAVVRGTPLGSALTSLDQRASAGGWIPISEFSQAERAAIREAGVEETTQPGPDGAPVPSFRHDQLAYLKQAQGAHAPAGEATSFTTSTGTTYDVDQGQTRRYQGSTTTLHPASDRTVYLSPGRAQRVEAHLRVFGAPDAETTATAHILDDGRVAVAVADKATGRPRPDLSLVLEASSQEPAVGLHPFEVWHERPGGVRPWHVGDAITDIEVAQSPRYERRRAAFGREEKQLGTVTEPTDVSRPTGPVPPPGRPEPPTPEPPAPPESRPPVSQAVATRAAAEAAPVAAEMPTGTEGAPPSEGAEPAAPAPAAPQPQPETQAPVFQAGNHVIVGRTDQSEGKLGVIDRVLPRYRNGFDHAVVVFPDGTQSTSPLAALQHASPPSTQTPASRPPVSQPTPAATPAGAAPVAPAPEEDDFDLAAAGDLVAAQIERENAAAPTEATWRVPRGTRTVEHPDAAGLRTRPAADIVSEAVEDQLTRRVQIAQLEADLKAATGTPKAVTLHDRLQKLQGEYGDVWATLEDEVAGVDHAALEHQVETDAKPLIERARLVRAAEEAKAAKEKEKENAAKGQRREGLKRAIAEGEAAPAKKAAAPEKPKAQEAEVAPRSDTSTVTVDGRPVRVTINEHADESARLVTVDTAAFDAAWRREPGFYLSEGGGPNAIGDRYAQFGTFLKDADAMEAAEVGVLENGTVGFTNGRHRFAWLRDHGVTAIPVAMDPESIANAKAHGYLADEPKRVFLENPPDVPRGTQRRTAATLGPGVGSALEGALSPEAQAGVEQLFSTRTWPEELGYIRKAMEVYEMLVGWDGDPAQVAEAQAIAAEIREQAEVYFKDPKARDLSEFVNAAYPGMQLIFGIEDPTWDMMPDANQAASAEAAGELIFQTLDPKTATFDVHTFNAEVSDVEFRREQADVFPTPTETVNLQPGRPHAVPNKKSKVGLGFRSGVPVLSQAEGAAKIAEWKAEAARLNKPENARKVVISIFDRTGNISEPWARAGYSVRRFDIRPKEDGGTAEDLIDFPVWLQEIETILAEGYEIVGVLGQPPCTSFTDSGAWAWPRHDTPNWQKPDWPKGLTAEERQTFEQVGAANYNWLVHKYGAKAAEHFDTAVDYANTLVAVMKLVVSQANPRFYVMENPAGRIDKLNGLPKETLIYNPDDYGEPYTKRTRLWGEFNPHLPQARVGGEKEEGGEGSRIYNTSSTDVDERSETATGFAYAFFVANQALAQEDWTNGGTPAGIEPDLGQKYVPASEEDLSPTPPRDEPHVIAFRSGNQDAPADLAGFIKAGQDVGVTARMSDAVRAALVQHVAGGGHAFIDSGAFGKTEIVEGRGVPKLDFNDVLAQYRSLAADVVTASGNEDAPAGLYVVAPDVAPAFVDPNNRDQLLPRSQGGVPRSFPDETKALQDKYAAHIAGLSTRGMTVIVPVQVGPEMATRAVDVARQWPDAMIGLPGNQGALSDAQLTEMLDALADAGTVPVGFHFLGVGETNKRFQSLVDLVQTHRAYEDQSPLITTDSSRAQALFGEGRKGTLAAEHIADTHARDRMRDAHDPLEIGTALFDDKNLDAFSEAEVNTIMRAMGATSRQQLQQWLDEREHQGPDDPTLEDRANATGHSLEDVIWEIAYARARAETPASTTRGQAIARVDAKVTPERKALIDRLVSQRPHAPEFMEEDPKRFAQWQRQWAHQDAEFRRFLARLSDYELVHEAALWSAVRGSDELQAFADSLPPEEEADADEKPGGAPVAVGKQAGAGQKVRGGDAEGSQTPGTRQEAPPTATQALKPGDLKVGDVVTIKGTSNDVPGDRPGTRYTVLKAEDELITLLEVGGQKADAFRSHIDSLAKAGGQADEEDVNPQLAAPENAAPAAQPEEQGDAAPPDQQQQADQVDRPTYPDGRLVPVAGDKVFQIVPGFGGTAAHIYGEVYKGSARPPRPNGLRVRITGSASLVTGSATGGKTQPLDARWTVVGDPILAKRRAIREQAEADRKAQDAREEAAFQAETRQKAATAIAELGHEPLTRETPVGSTVVDHYTGEITTLDGQHPEFGPTLDGRTIGNAEDGTWDAYTVVPMGRDATKGTVAHNAVRATVDVHVQGAAVQTRARLREAGFIPETAEEEDWSYPLEGEPASARYSRNVERAETLAHEILQRPVAKLASFEERAQGWTRAHADAFLSTHGPALARAGFRPEIVGGVSRTGKSANDLDIVLHPVTPFSSVEQAEDAFIDHVAEGLGEDPDMLNWARNATHEPGNMLRVFVADNWKVVPGAEKIRAVEFYLPDAIYKVEKKATAPASRPAVSQTAPVEKMTTAALRKAYGVAVEAGATDRATVLRDEIARRTQAANQRQLEKDSRPLPAGTTVLVARNGAPVPRGWTRTPTEAERALIFTPGHVVKSYTGSDTVTAYTPTTMTSGWRVTVRSNEHPDEGARTHATEPSVVKDEYRDRVKPDWVHTYTAPAAAVVSRPVVSHGAAPARPAQTAAQVASTAEEVALMKQIGDRLQAKQDAERARLQQQQQAPKGNASVGAYVEPVKLDRETIKLVVQLARTYMRRGDIATFEAAAVRFHDQWQQIMPERNAALDRLAEQHFELAWPLVQEHDRLSKLPGQSMSAAERMKAAMATVVAQPNRPTVAEAVRRYTEAGGTHGTTNGAVAGGPQGASGLDGGTGGPVDGPGGPTGTDPGAAPQTQSRPGARNRQRRTLPGPGGDPGLTPGLYTITDADAIGTGTKPERVARNFAAIRIAKQLAEEQRLATPDEQRALVRYVGWGGLSRIFEPWKNDLDDPDDRKANQSKYWQDQNGALRALLTDEEFRRASNSTQNAHYTSPDVIRAMWAAVERLGVTHGSALEPSSGIGHFVGLMPPSLRGALNWALVEKDAMTAQIAAALYPDAYTQNTGFEDASLPDNHFAVNISNVPFGLIPITDRAFQGPPFVRQRIHNYFFGKGLDKLAPGGLEAFITSHGTLDATDAVGQQVREYLAGRADLLGAIRLPFTAFKGTAGTEVVTDIIFLRKRAEGQAPAHAGDWMKSVPLEGLKNKEGESFTHHVNEYFLAHPEMVLGTHTATGKMRAANQYNVEPTGDLATQLAAAVARLPEHAIDLNPTGSTLAAFQNTTPPPGTRPFEIVLHEGQIAEVMDGNITPIEGLTAADEARLRGLLPIRAALRNVYAIMADPDADSAALTAAQTQLTKAYDAFVDQHGYISEADNWKAFREDPDFPLLLSLEEYDDERGTATKTAVFTKRTLPAERAARRAETPAEALQLVLGERGRIDLDRAGELLGVSADEAGNQLEDAGLILDTPSGWQLPAQYLSGNVRVKLAEAQAAAQMDPRYTTAVERLQAVIPPDIPAYKINVRLGATWVPPEMVTQFVAHIVNKAPDQLEWTIFMSPFDAKWGIEGPPGAHLSQFATPDIDTKTLLLAALNDRRPTVRMSVPNPTGEGTIRVINPEATVLARQRREEIHKAFAEWLFNADPDRRAWAVRTYNDRFNALVEPHVDGSYLTFPGMSEYWRGRIRPTQRNGIARGLQFGNTLAAWAVGAGKSLWMAGTGMELRRMGLARKPLYVVPNHLISQAPSEFLQYYPNAQLLVAQPEDLEKENRRRFTARIAAGDWDGVMMPLSTFVRLSMSAEAETAYHRELLDEIETAIIEEWRAHRAEQGGNRGAGGRPGRTPPSIKQLENTRDRLQEKLDKLAARPKDDMLSFEELGVDALIIDEAHLFKNLYFYTRQKQVAGIPSENEAQRATDLYLKARYINRLSNYRNVFLATGTPVSNSMAEVYVMQKLLQEQRLEQAGIANFDAWLQQFGLVTVGLELDSSGTGVSHRTRLTDFRNLPDLAQMFRQVADVKMIDDLPDVKAARPPMETGNPEVVAVPATERQLAYLRELADRAEHLDPKARHLDNMGKITQDGRLSALDQRLIDRTEPDDPKSKLNRMVADAATILNQHKANKGTIVVFMDRGTPGSEVRPPLKSVWDPNAGMRVRRPLTPAEKLRGFNLYADFKRKLVATGAVKASEVASIHDIDNVPKKKRDAFRKSLFRKVREGEIRVLMGSSDKMATGLNVQDRLVAELNADPTYKPSETEQRYGRIMRPGNLFATPQLGDGSPNPLYDPDFKIRVLNYVTQGVAKTFGMDAVMWQLNEAKAKFIADFFKGKIEQRDATLDLDNAVISAGTMKAIATGNPLIIEQAKAAAEADRLRLLRAGWEDQVREAGWTRGAAQLSLDMNEKVIASLRGLLSGVTPKGEALTATVKGQDLEGPKAIGEAVLEAVKKETNPNDAHPGVLNSRAAYNPTELGTMRGLTIWLVGNKEHDPIVVLRHHDDPPQHYGYDASGKYEQLALPAHVASAAETARGGRDWPNPQPFAQRLSTEIDHAGTRLVLAEHELQRYRERLAHYDRILQEGFAQQGEYDAAMARLDDLNRQLGIGGDQEVEAIEEEEGQTGGAESDMDYTDDGGPLAAGAGGGDDGTTPPTRQAGDVGDGGDEAVAPDEVGPWVNIPTGDGGTARVRLYPVEFPELIAFAQMLIGTPVVVPKFRGEGIRGQFVSGALRSGIRLHADLFKPGNERQLAATISHELGHVTDWLPDHIIEKGKGLLGRLLSIRGFIDTSFTAKDGTTLIEDATIRKELWDLSTAWRPLEIGATPDKKTDPKGYRKFQDFMTYRKSGAELYADALSALLVDPDFAQQHAPTFVEQFFDHLDQKPAVKDAYFAIYELLSGTREQLMERRELNARRMFREANLRSIELLRLKRAERQSLLTNIWDRMVHLMTSEASGRQPETWEAVRRVAIVPNVHTVLDSHVWALDRMRRDAQTLPPDKRVRVEENPYFALRDRPYKISGRSKAWGEQVVQPIFNRLLLNKLSWEDFGLKLMYDRVTAGDRSHFANPKGYQPEQVREMHDHLWMKLTPEQREVLSESVDAFRAAVKAIVEEMYERGMISKEKWDEIKKNPAYATFHYVEHLEDELTHHIFQQRGSLGDIRNPADATVLKTMASIAAIEHQRAKEIAFDYLDRYHPTDVQDANVLPLEKGGVTVLQPPRSAGLALVMYYKDGHAVGKYVDPMIADSLNNFKAPIWQWVEQANGLMKTGFTTIRPGYLVSNSRKDFKRFWRNLPGMTRRRALKRYWQARHLAVVRAYGLASPEASKIRKIYRTIMRRPATSPTATEQAAWDDLVAAEKAGILGTTFSEHLDHEIEGEMILNILAALGVGPTRKAARRLAARPFLGARDTLRRLNDFIETLPPGAGMYEVSDPTRRTDRDARDKLKGFPLIDQNQGRVERIRKRDRRTSIGERAIGRIPADIRHYIRSRWGSPDWLAGGTHKKMFNNVLLFSNAFGQALEEDLDVATDPTTMSGFWYKTFVSNLLPKLVTRAALLAAKGSALLAGAATVGLLASSPPNDKEGKPKRLVKQMLAKIPFLAWGGNILRKQSRYQLTNKLVIPLWVDPNGKGHALAVPQEETGRFIGGVFYKLLEGIDGDKDFWATFSDVLDYAVGQLPSTTALIGVPWAAGSFATGHNPEDYFRQTPVLTAKEQAARSTPYGREHALHKFLAWEFQQVGGDYIHRFYTPDDKPVQDPGPKIHVPIVGDVSAFKIPVLGTEFLSRYYLVTDAGEAERNRATGQEFEGEHATAGLIEDQAVADTLRKYYDLPKSQQHVKTQQRLAVDLAHQLYPTERDPDKKKQNERRLTGNMMLSVIHGDRDPLAGPVSRARSNEEKIEMIVGGREQYTPQKFQTWLLEAQRTGFISKELAADVRQRLAGRTAPPPMPVWPPATATVH